jgi:hypothetical protein
MANLGFSKQKMASILLLLTCIIGSLVIDSMMKSQEGFQEGADNKGPSNEKDLKKAINKVLDDNKKSSKSMINAIQDIIGKYINNNNINNTVNEVVNILNMNIDADKQVNMVIILLSTDK